MVLIPALPEESCIAQTVGGWRELGAALVRVVRVVDNGSTDDTARVAAAAGVEVLREATRGYVAACRACVQRVPVDAGAGFMRARNPQGRIRIDQGHRPALADETSLRGLKEMLVEPGGCALCFTPQSHDRRTAGRAG